jgi:hypothetical protein
LYEALRRRDAGFCDVLGKSTNCMGASTREIGKSDMGLGPIGLVLS